MIRKKLKLAESNRKQEQKEQINPSTNAVDASPYFDALPIWQQLYDIECRMSQELSTITFKSANVAAVYNPIEYASDLHCAYMKKFLDQTKAVVFIGMNPGPFGMVQTGVPFGHIPSVRNWMKLSGNVGKPKDEIAARQVTGLLCDKSEQSGQRFWGLMEELSGANAEHFFRNCYVHNLCPLAFFTASGRNLTPAELKPDKKKILQEICTKYLAESIKLLSPVVIVSIGRYVEDRVTELIKKNAIDSGIEHKCIPHPSPRSLNNTNWNEKAKKWLIDNDIMKYIE